MIGGASESAALSLRSGCYRILARGFTRPSVGDATAFQQAGAILESLGLDSHAFAPAMWLWLEALGEADWGALHREYVRLFESSSDGATCRPLESQHLGPGRVGEPALLAALVEAALRRYGGRVDDARPADHVAWQLELGARMCAAEGDAWARGDTLALAQGVADLHELARRLERWVPRLHRSLQRHDRTGVYAALGSAAVAFIMHEVDLTGQVLAAGS